MVDAVKPCPICGADRERRADGHLIHAIFTEETWALHCGTHEEEVKQSISRERAAEDNKPPQSKPVFGGWWT